ncbi:MAG: serine protease [Verrucomicrobiota bacterium]
MKKIGMAVSAWLFLFSVWTEAHESKDEGAEVYRKTSGALVRIHVFSGPDNAKSIGSGFAVSERLVVTNWHVIEGANRIRLRFVTSGTKWMSGAVVAKSRAHDLAVVRLSKDAPKFLELRKEGMPPIGSRVYTLGNPDGYDGIIAEGLLSGIWKSKKSGREEMQISAPISQGSSGGPVLDTHGVVIGVAKSVNRKGQNLNFAAPNKYLLPLIAEVNSSKHRREEN